MRRAIRLLTVAAAISLAGATAAGAASSIELRGRTTAVHVGADGSFTAAVVRVSPDETTQSATLARVDPTGRLAGQTPLLARSQGYGTVLGVPTAAGGILLADAFGEAPELSVVTRSSEQAAPSPAPFTTLSDPGVHATLRGSVEVGANGAVAAVFGQAPASGALMRLALRPAGAAAFTVSAPFAAGPDAVRFAWEVFVGPDGGGVLVGQPHDLDRRRTPIVHRFAPDGTVGPAHPAPTGPVNGLDVDAGAAFTAGGTVVLAFATRRSTRTGERGRLLLASLEPGAASFSHVHRLSRDAPVALEDDLAMTAGPGELVSILAARGRRGLVLYEGSPAGPRRAASIKTRYPADARLALLDDGRHVAVWLGARRGGGAPAVVMAATRAPGGSFGPAHPLLGVPRVPLGTTRYLEHVRALPGGRVAVVYGSADGPQTTSLLAASP